MKKYFIIGLLLLTGCFNDGLKSPKVGDCYMTDDRLPNMEVDKIVRIDDNEVEFRYTFLMEEEWKGKWATSELRMFIVQKRKDFLELRVKTECPW